MIVTNCALGMNNNKRKREERDKTVFVFSLHQKIETPTVFQFSRLEANFIFCADDD
jgi:hypothetical protein